MMLDMFPDRRFQRCVSLPEGGARCVKGLFCDGERIGCFINDGAGTVRHWCVLPDITESRNDFLVTLAGHSQLTSEKSHLPHEQRDASVNAERGRWVTDGRSGSLSTQFVVIDMALAAEGAALVAEIIANHGRGS